MIEKLLRMFSGGKSNNASYVPLLLPRSETAKPLSLIIKRKRSIWKRPFAKDEMIFLAGLENFVSSDCEKEYREAVKLKVLEEGVIESAPVDRHTKDDFDIARIGLTADGNPVDLQLGRVGQKYILDPDLRGILSRVVLDANKMIPYQDQELFLITSVVYSNKFEVVEVPACYVSPMQFPVPGGLKSKLLGKYKKTSTPPEVAIRDSRRPILFKHCRVQYNKETKKLEIIKAEFAGKYKITSAMSLVKEWKCEVFNYDGDDDDDVKENDVDNDDPVDMVANNIFAVKRTRHVCLAKDLKCEDDASNTDNDDGDNNDEKTLKPLRFDKQLRHDSFNDDEDDCGDEPNNNDDVDGDSERIPVDVVADDILPVLDDFNYRDMRNIEHVYANVLLSTKSRIQQKALVKKYLGWFEELLTADKMKILLNEPLTSNDCTFLSSLYVAALPDQDTLDFTKKKKAEVHRYGFILKLIDELSDEEWEELGIPSN
ncbi:uncharacterized protein [Acropora muricata]|uniref:uncharacterized protein isoform X1 n=1 Tax=Acropora muricata TaxID=159855 RepID=UPI0034E5D364